MPYKDKELQKEYQRNWFIKNQEKHKVSTLKGRAKMREANRAYVATVKSKPCMDCGVSYPYYVMDFDHRPGTNKISKVAVLADQQSLDKVKEEIAKCDLVCSNCHRERTHSRKYGSIAPMTE